MCTDNDRVDNVDVDDDDVPITLNFSCNCTEIQTTE